MSTDRIEFNGDELARRVPLLAEAKESFKNVVVSLDEIAACHWADGVPDDDKATLQARDAVQGMFGQYLFPGYDLCSESFGFQGEKAGVVHRIGVNTEGTSTDMADFGSKHG